MQSCCNLLYAVEFVAEMKLKCVCSLRDEHSQSCLKEKSDICTVLVDW